MGIGGWNIEMSMKGENLSSRFIRIVVVGILGAEHGASNAAFSGAVDSGQHIDPLRRSISMPDPSETAGIPLVYFHRSRL
jgi:hypothetical protein